MSHDSHWMLAEGLSLGIDAGGTYTDAVIFDFAARRVIAAAKSPTTPQDYALGIARAIDQLPQEHVRQVRLVGLSTTLATNALVQSRGGRVGIVLAGMHNVDLSAFRFPHLRHIAGAIDISGRESEPLDVAGAEVALRELIDEDQVEALALAGISSVRNPAHELRLRELARGLCDLPIVCAHELSQDLGAGPRANTAALNARLLPLIARLLSSMREVLSSHGIRAPLYIVKGDGSLLDWRAAARRPIETVASGPAASMVGARTLIPDAPDMLIVDVGGTTSDVALLSGGRPILHKHGARVAGQRLAIHGVALSTAGLGGDSRIVVRKSYRRGESTQVSVGPDRVIPLCHLAAEHPEVLPRLHEFMERPKSVGGQHLPGDFLLLLYRPREGSLRPNQARLVDALADGPLHLSEASKRAGVMDSKLLGWEELVRSGAVALAGLAPTDLWHVRGDLDLWNREAAEVSARMYAERLEAGVPELLEQVFSVMREDLATLLAASCLDDDPDARESPVEFAREYVRRTIAPGRWLALRPQLAVPLVGIGAPAHLALPGAAEVLSADLRLPEYAAVANAVGAASARIEMESHVLVKDSGSSTYTVHTLHEQAEFRDLDEAMAFGRQRAREIAEESARAAGAVEFEVHVDEHEFTIRGPAHLGGDTFLSCDLSARVVGRPA